MIRFLFSVSIFMAVPFLQSCDSVSRFGDTLDPRSSSQRLPLSDPSPNYPAPISATPTAPVSAQPLPPPPPRFASSVNPNSLVPPTTLPQNGGLASPILGGVSAPASGGLVGGGLTPDSSPLQNPKVANITPSASVKLQTAAPAERIQDTAPEKPVQSRLTGGWSVTQGSGSKCRLTLSNSPALDLYRANTTGCGAGLTKVNAWELRGNEIYLYEQGGGVAARLKQAGNTSFSGSTAKSGAPVSISK